jgi:hypothetical protein
VGEAVHPLFLFFFAIFTGVYNMPSIESPRSTVAGEPGVSIDENGEYFFGDKPLSGGTGRENIRQQEIHAYSRQADAKAWGQKHPDAKIFEAIRESNLEDIDYHRERAATIRSGKFVPELGKWVD